VNLILGLISLESRKIEQIKEKKRNLFDVLTEEIEKESRKKKKPILIIDEIQKLRDVYIENGNGERELLKEFLNFCVRLTKERHLSHVVILTSNTVFIERLYNDAKMKETSRFKKIDHLTKEKVEEWLKVEGFDKEAIELVWEYLGGNIGRILEAIKIHKNGKDLKKFLEEQKWLAYSEIVDYLTEFEDKEREFFIKVAEEIVKNGFYSLEKIKKNEKRLLQKWAEKEILFYDPLKLKVTGNSRIYEKGLELLLERHIHT
jgi:AAA+ ATPase superfamily predicted ATPase